MCQHYRVNRYLFLQYLISSFTELGYIAPDLIRDWQISKADLVPVLSAALIGAAIGAIVLGPLADRLGRKTLLLFSVFIFSCSCLLSSFAQSVTQLEILRFITGLGLGAALPNAVTLLSEYCPSHKRAFIVNTMYCGFPIGAATGGFAAAERRFTFTADNADGMAAARICAVFAASRCRPITDTEYFAKNKCICTAAKVSLRSTKSATIRIAIYADVFSSQYLAETLSLWLCFFCGLMIFYSIINWMPVLFKEAGMPPHLGPVVSGLFALGGAGAMLNGWLMDYFNGNHVIAVCTFFTAICVALIGPALHIFHYPDDLCRHTAKYGAVIFACIGCQVLFYRRSNHWGFLDVRYRPLWCSCRHNVHGVFGQ
ncbi:MFS transporter [Acinetobacter bouvetii]|uniref:MFS transporter n=1 Tax=Acinetobacter bouvetii TaxID=202951 RepID=UPI0013EEAE2C|nr:MFS transporter [Acinetobacter bouvetii]